MATVHAVQWPSISATCYRRRRELLSHRRPRAVASELMERRPAVLALASAVLPGPGPLTAAVATAREPAPAAGPFSAGRTRTTPAAASPARISPQMSLENVTCSYFGPVADKVVIDPGQFDRFRVISPKPLHQGLNRGIEIENQAAGVG